MVLREHPLMRLLPADEGTALAKKARILEFEEGDLPFDEGDLAESIYLVLSGRVVLEKRGHSREYLTLAEIVEGGYVGELAVLDGSLRAARARAITEVSLAEVSATDLFAALERSPSRAIIDFFVPVVRNLRARSNRFIGEILRKEKLAVVGEMADSIMHDLRSPLTTIQLACDLLRRELKNPASERYCDMADKQIRVLQDMMEELLEFSRGTPRLKKTRISIDELFSRFKENNELILARSAVELSIESAKGMLEIDIEKVLRVLQNLFNNAIEATGHRGAIRLCARTDGKDHAVLSMSDNGPGIPEEIRDRLFEPFITHGKERGTGMGLAIVKSLLEAHKGTVSVSAETGRGTEFKLVLPLAAGRRPRAVKAHDT